MKLCAYLLRTIFLYSSSVDVVDVDDALTEGVKVRGHFIVFSSRLKVPIFPQ